MVDAVDTRVVSGARVLQLEWSGGVQYTIFHCFFSARARVFEMFPNFERFVLGCIEIEITNFVGLWGTGEFPAVSMGIQ